MKRLAILGASGHGKVVAEIAELNGWDLVFFDDAYPKVKTLAHWSVVGHTKDLLEALKDFDGCFVAIGNNHIRLDKQKSLVDKGALLPSLIHPAAVVSQYAKIGKGSVIMAGAVINPFVQINHACIINTSATVDHDCVLADGVHISPGANVAGEVVVGERSWVGIGAAVKQCLTLGADTIIGAGSVVVKDIPDKMIAKGVPATWV